MKLLACHVEGFGALSAFDLSFEPGLNALLRPNGAGKTTLIAFLRAMLYGFPARGKSDRAHYRPWQGGSYGGWLSYETKTGRFRVERFFGASAKGDTFALYDLATGARIEDATPALGLALFGLDADAFTRCAIWAQGPLPDGFATASIEARLTNLVEATADIGSYDLAMERLRAARARLTPYRGTGGVTAQAQRAYQEAEAALEGCRGCKERAAELAAQLDALTAQQNQASRQPEVEAALQELDALEAQRQRLAAPPRGMVWPVVLLGLAAVLAGAVLAWAVRPVLGAALAVFGAAFGAVGNSVCVRRRRAAYAAQRSAYAARSAAFRAKLAGWRLPPGQTLRVQLESLRNAPVDVSAYANRIAALRLEREACLEQLEELPAHREVRDRALAALRKAQADTKTLDATMELLSAARASLAGTYLDTLRARLQAYARQFGMESVWLDAALRPAQERHGAIRQLEEASAGEAARLLLCMRLALADALFAEEMPPLLLDDPFAELDDTHLATALDLMRTLGTSRQILYLTCQAGRMA